MILGKVTSIMIITPSLANSAIRDWLLATLGPVMTLKLIILRRHLIPKLFLVGASLPLMTFLITVITALIIRKGLFTETLPSALLALGAYLLKRGVDSFLNSCLKTSSAQVRFILLLLGRNLGCPHTRTKHLFILVRSLIKELSVGNNDRLINLVFVEVVGGIEVGCGLLRHMSDSPNAKHFAGGLKIFVGNVVKKILVPISSTPSLSHRARISWFMLTMFSPA